MKEEDCDLWVMEMPMLIILAFNTFFLIWIISVNKNLPHSTSWLSHLQIVILKLKQRTAMDHDRRHWKATKALIFVMPLLGFGFEPSSAAKNLEIGRLISNVYILILNFVFLFLLLLLTIIICRHILTLVVKPAVASLGLPTATLVFNAIEAVIVSTQVLIITLFYTYTGHWMKEWVG